MINTVTENGNHQNTNLIEKANLRKTVAAIVNTTSVFDIHTHLFTRKVCQPTAKRV
jgi:hypothetical protein